MEFFLILCNCLSDPVHDLQHERSGREADKARGVWRAKPCNILSRLTGVLSQLEKISSPLTRKLCRSIPFVKSRSQRHKLMWCSNIVDQLDACLITVLNFTALYTGMCSRVMYVYVSTAHTHYAHAHGIVDHAFEPKGNPQ